MAISVTCAMCGAKLRAPDRAAGRSSKCPKCGDSVAVPGSAPPDIDISGLPEIDVSPASARRRTPLPVRSQAVQPPPVEIRPPAISGFPVKETHECPFCGEEILARARKCKHCGEMLDASLRAVDEARRFAEHSSRGASAAAAASTTVVVQHSAQFPHFLHLVMTVFTLGLWFPIWVLHYIFRSR